MSLPSLTSEQRAEALKKAARARAKRAEVKAALKAGSISLSAVLEQAQEDETLAKMRVIALIESLPGIGKVRAALVMEHIGIAKSRRLRGLGAKQTQALIARFDPLA